MFKNITTKYCPMRDATVYSHPALGEIIEHDKTTNKITYVGDKRNKQSVEKLLKGLEAALKSTNIK